MPALLRCGLSGFFVPLSVATNDGRTVNGQLVTTSRHSTPLHARLVFTLKFTTIAILALVYHQPILHAYACRQVRTSGNRAGHDVL